jgi:8-oxo-dGTP pyrophosphatase MutT (NUDIX family)
MLRYANAMVAHPLAEGLAAPKPVTSRPGYADRAWRAAYWLAYRLARQWWRLRHPLHHGAVIAVWLDGQILGVRQSYTREITWPGGGIDPQEDARAAAQRELREELGLTVALEDLHQAGEMTHEWEYRQDHVRIFEVRLTAAPVLTPDGREIIHAAFMPPHAMLAAPTPPFVTAYLRARLGA